jgi:hypothetical protein
VRNLRDPFAGPSPRWGSGAARRASSGSPVNQTPRQHPELEGGFGESAGISRHGEGDENALRRRSSYSRRPRVMRWRSVRAQRSVDRGRAGGAIEPRNSSSSGCRRSANMRKATLLAALLRAVGGPCAVEDPRHARRAPCARTGRSSGRPRVVDDAPSWMVRGVADQRLAGREGNAEAVIP